MKSEGANKKIIIILVAVFLLGIFLRVYNFEKNLLFEIDQARDWKNALISDREGIGSLPLLGPKAGGTEFRLGPISNYFQYFSFKLFGHDPASTSLPDLFFAILSLPLAYVFFRQFFSEKIALILLGLNVVSLFSIEYSRFGWNPNSVPFFTLLFFLTLIKIINNSENKKIWFAVMAIASGIVIQLHTIAMVCIPIILVISFFWCKVRVKISEALIFFGVLVVILSPIVVHEIVTNLRNSKAFFAEIGDRNEGNDKFPLDKKIILGAYEIGKNYQIILFSDKYTEDLNFTRKSKNGIDLIRKNLDKKTSFIVIFFIWIFIVGAIILMWSRIKNTSNKKLSVKLIMLWQAVYLLVLFYLADDKHDTRLYLGISFLPFIYTGFYLEYLWERRTWIGVVMTGVIIIFCVNLINSVQWLLMTDRYRTETEVNDKEFILESYFNITLSQYESLTDRIAENYLQDKKEVRIMGHVYLLRSILHLLNYGKLIPTLTDGGFTDKSKHYYFIANNVVKKEGLNKLPDDIEKSFTIDYSENFGTLVLFSLKLKEDILENPEPATYVLVDERNIGWRDVFR